MVAHFAAVKGKTYILDLTHCDFADISGVYAFEDEINAKRDAGSTVYLVADHKQNLIDLREKVGKDKVFTNVKDALAAAV